MLVVERCVDAGTQAFASSYPLARQACPLEWRANSSSERSSFTLLLWWRVKLWRVVCWRWDQLALNSSGVYDVMLTQITFVSPAAMFLVFLPPDPSLLRCRTLRVCAAASERWSCFVATTARHGRSTLLTAQKTPSIKRLVGASKVKVIFFSGRQVSSVRLSQHASCSSYLFKLHSWLWGVYDNIIICQLTQASCLVEDSHNLKIKTSTKPCNKKLNFKQPTY